MGGSSTPDPFEALSDEEIEARIRAARARLAELGERDVDSIPMRDLTDAELDERIARVDAELGADPASQDRATRATALRMLEQLDYLIEHPDASLPPLGRL